jgi:hypothetical protein
VQTSLDGPITSVSAYFGSLNFKKPSAENTDEIISPLNRIFFIFEFLLKLKLEVDWIMLCGIVTMS